MPDALAPASVRVLVVDPHAPSRIGLAAVLERQTWIDRCLLAAGRQEALDLARLHPDLAIIDIPPLGELGGSLPTAIRATHPGIRILLSSRCSSSPPVPVANLGAVGFLPAGISADAAVDLVRAAVLEERLEPSATPTMAMTDRERLILSLLATGMTNREIGERLHLGPDSIKKTASSLYRKLGVRNRTEAVHWAATLSAS